MGNDRTPNDIVNTAKRLDCKSISYTYTEPTIYFEYAYETTKLASQEGLKNNFVTNGFINQAPLEKIGPYLDAANIDLKSFSEDFYKKICGAELHSVLDSIRTYKRIGIWIEITTLVIPNLNDSPDELKQIAEFIAKLGKEIPWHVTAFYPTYRLTGQPRTSSRTLLEAREIGLQAGLRYVYTGNVPGEKGENTYCYSCGTALIQRFGFQIAKNILVNASCPECKTKIDGRDSGNAARGG